jgi:hypothetical protein
MVARPRPANWVCLTHFTLRGRSRRDELGLFRTFLQVATSYRLPTAPFCFKIINHQSEGVPLPLLSVARIMPEFCARTTPQNGTTLCAERNKEFLARQVLPFQLLHKRGRGQNLSSRQSLP